MQRNSSSLSLLALRLALILNALPPSANPRLDPRQQVEVAAADEDAGPKSQLCAVDGHAKDIEFRLKKDVFKRDDIAGSIDTDENEAYTSHSPVDVYIPVVAKDTCSEQDCCEDCHEGHRPRDVVFSGCLQGKNQGNFDSSHQKAHPYQNNCTLDKAPMSAIIIALTPCQ